MERTRKGGSYPIISTAVALLLLALTGCGGSEPDDAAESTKKSQAKTTTTTTVAASETTDTEKPPEPSGPTMDMTLVSDPVNNAFTVEVPVGWDNLVYSTVDGQIHHEVVNSVSPDGETVLFVGDPKIPSFWNPDTADPMTRQFAEALESMDLEYYTPAPAFLDQYVSKKFGQLADYSMTSIEPDADRQQRMSQAFTQAGVNLVAADSADARFTYTDSAGRTTNALILGNTVDGGPFWQADVLGIATTGSPEDYVEMLAAIFNSRKTNPEFTASQNQRHQDTMSMIQQNTEAMTKRHEANMAQIQASANAHQQRMQAIWDANDASMSNFYNRMNSSDVQHRQFLNYINEENTVQNSSGQKLQVDNSYQRYWVNKNDNSYVGGDINFDDDQLRAMGLNPSDYEEAQIVKG